MAHLNVVAALESYRLSAALVDDARLLWENGRVPRAAALAVFSLEADAKANEWISEVTGIPTRRAGDTHRRRIEAGLISLAAIFDERLDAILGTELATLSPAAAWDLRQGALYVDLMDEQLLTPGRVTIDKAAAVIAAATNVVNSRKVLGTDAELLTEFLADYGEAYRTHILPILDEGGGDAWATASASLEADLSRHWVFGDDQSHVLRRRVSE